MKKKKEVKKSFMNSFTGMNKETVTKIIGGDSGDTTGTSTDPDDRRAHQTIKIWRPID